jgi:hypothetical protein
VSALSLVAVSAGLSTPSSTRLLADRLKEATREHLAEGSRPVEVTVIGRLRLPQRRSTSKSRNSRRGRLDRRSAAHRHP